jgi:hypothetical protein
MKDPIPTRRTALTDSPKTVIAALPLGKNVERFGTNRASLYTNIASENGRLACRGMTTEAIFPEAGNDMATSRFGSTTVTFGYRLTHNTCEQISRY